MGIGQRSTMSSRSRNHRLYIVMANAALLLAVVVVPNAIAEVIVLSCEGETPVFDHGYRAGASYWAKKSQLVRLDTSAKLATTMATTNRQETADLRIDEEFYSFSFSLGFEREGMRIKSEDWSINRYNGNASGSIDVFPPPRGERGGYNVFTGKCVPSKQLF